MRETGESNVKQEQDQTARFTAASAFTVTSSSRMHIYRFPPLPHFPMRCPTSNLRLTVRTFPPSEQVDVGFSLAFVDFCLIRQANDNASHH
ncbi:hypothetical protein BT96DRAFT_233743 [Gymnopus androsaceus JB14]|uniref:Uncharacterized protein n=1 Tax=Gymnopus androsaceus JB14 TaxID=1447944 RepID=A0A6A4H4Q9_9AGAR|nr:hypothetical protein BT96DRAFT_233743 [Gymnopus androsaceus JB14]